MANVITGTNEKDNLTGTAGDDIINGLAGDDFIIGSTGKDTINGGDGSDTIDFSGISQRIFLNTSGTRISDLPLGSSRYYGGPSPQSTITTSLENIETIIGNPNQSNTIDGSDLYSPRNPLFSRIDVDLAANRLTYYAPGSNISKTFTVKNFDNITDSYSSGSQLRGNDRNNVILGGNSKNTVFGSKGDDNLNTNGTIDYSNLGRGVKFVLQPYKIDSGSGLSTVKIDKNGFGVDVIYGLPKFVGTANQANLIDASNVSNNASIDVNLANNSLKTIDVDPAIRSGIGDREYTLQNFVDVIGSKYDDKIVGANQKSTLTGGGGQDKITGGSDNDIITGSDATARGVGEVDTLTGGGGKDKFVLGDSNGAYYVGKGKNDYALITDFNLFEDSISIGSLKNYSFALAGQNTIALYSGKNVRTRDLIAKIQISDGVSTSDTLSPNAILNSIVGKINIISA